MGLTEQGELLKGMLSWYQRRNEREAKQYEEIQRHWEAKIALLKRMNDGG
jgi:hypothetical protein